MKLADKIKILENDHFSEWYKTRVKVSEQISASQSMFCVCGRLATGLHETSCRKLANKINAETVKQLSGLLSEVKK